ncbi:energy-dependent translational throttle protein EttA [Candidatus Uabimicrobium amorphum]|uniref:Energy-dependent translational throttle protein EttA n=1 Tax=Uabimicrobium amorphum TaxID=2596890 RepID=A0A5S9IQG3_UABAM|nr:energy-dependent translational throttle protein EttA [Candidatus Uabimicrobium amorphum]BBM86024.1 energy-dependent translational throttle protein EttA [Candidatus Uabimicrobium amorphum]
MSYQYTYVMKGVSKVYPNSDKKILKDIWLSFLPGAKIGVIGHNGAGKSTLLRIMAGEDTTFEGEAWPAKGVKVGFLPQEPRLNAEKNVLENVMEGVAEKQAVLDRYEKVNDLFAEITDDDEMNALIEEQGKLQEQIDAENLWDLERQIEIAMDALRCPPAESNVDSLSGGEKRRVALCRLLLQKPDMLLLDEPTNHLDAESVAWLERFLREYAGTVVLITHDRYFLDNVTGWILELDRGEGIPWEGNYSSWLEQKHKRLKDEEKRESARQKYLQKELDWVRQSPKARQAKNKARIRSYNELAEKEQTKVPGIAQIVIPNGPRLGNLVVEGNNITKGYGEKLLIDNFSFKLPAGGIVGIIGANGAGKTTLFRMIAQSIDPDNGDLKFGDTVKIGYVDQSRDALDDKQTVWEEISGGQDEISLGQRMVKSRAYCASFNFRGGDQQKPVGVLSGGERNRVHLAKMLREHVNLLLLDEPTNDLDVETLRALEEAIHDFAGCVMVISHDRWFLDRIATHIIAFEGDSKVVWFEGNYASYEADRRERLGEDADKPRRIKYKPLTI